MKDGTAKLGALIVTSTATAAEAVIAARSVARHHPQLDAANIDVVVVDDRFSEVVRACANEPGTWRRAVDVLPVDFVLRLLAQHETARVIAALTPSLVRLAIGRHQDGVCLIGDHVEIRRPLAFFDQVPPHGSIGLIPVRESHVPTDGRFPDAADLSAYGRFQRDLVMFGPGTIISIKQWIRNVAEQPLDDAKRFDRLTYPWFDDLPLTAPVLVGPSAELGSYRNLDVVGGAEAVSALSFEGFTVDRPWAISQLAGEWPRVLVSDDASLRSAVAYRAQELVELEGRWEQNPYRNLANGHRYDAAMRHMFSRSLAHSMRHGADAPPNPFSEPAAFVDYLAGAAPDRPGISRHLAAWAAARPDLAATFATDDNAFWRWAVTDLLASGGWTPPREHALNLVSSTPKVVQPEAAGVNVVGLLSAQLGVGEQARLALQAVSDSGIPHSIVDHDDTAHERDLDLIDSSLANGFAFDVDLFLVNADQTRSALRAYDRGGKSDRPTIGLWAWETPVFPERFHDVYASLSEVWVLSEFIHDALLPSATLAGVSVEVLPVQLPYVVDRRPAKHFADLLTPLGVDPTRPFVSFMFDYFSVADRKQPWRTIEAFIKAFPVASNTGPQLVIKSMNHEFFPLDRERVLFAARNRPDIVLVETYLGSEQRHALIAAASAYMSLHCAEGFGLTLAEAMGAGTPCIATGWSGNLNFMTEQNSWMVDHELVDIPRTVRHYGGLGQWADPSVEHAAQLLQRVFDDPVEAERRAHQAVSDLIARNQSGADALFVVDRIRSLRTQTQLPHHLPHMVHRHGRQGLHGLQGGTP